MKKNDFLLTDIEAKYLKLLYTSSVENKKAISDMLNRINKTLEQYTMLSDDEQAKYIKDMIYLDGNAGYLEEIAESLINIYHNIEDMCQCKGKKII